MLTRPRPNNYAAVTRYVLGFQLLSGKCTHHSLDSMHREITAWMNMNAGHSWLVVRRGESPIDHTHIDDSVKVVQRGAIIGTYMDKDIIDFFICADGGIYEYTGVLSDMRQVAGLPVGMRLMAPGLLYQEAARQAR